MLGPSGCGKTTTLRMIGGFEEPTRGTIYLDGRDVTDRPPYKRDVNTVFQSYALFPHLNVYENVAFGLRAARSAARDIKTRVDEALDLVDLIGFEKRKPAQMSGGQQQRVALARALVNRPKVLLLDEPLGALDLKLRKQMQLELKRIQQEVGITFIYVTHDQEEAMTMSDRLAVMRHGQDRADRSARGRLREPADAVRRGVPRGVEPARGRAQGAGGAAPRRCCSPVATSSACRRTARRSGPATEVLVGVRPEKITIAPDNGSRTTADRAGTASPGCCGCRRTSA